MDWIGIGNGRYRVLAEGWYADVRMTYADGTWFADVLKTNSTLPESEIQDIAIRTINAA